MTDTNTPQTPAQEFYALWRKNRQMLWDGSDRSHSTRCADTANRLVTVPSHDNDSCKHTMQIELVWACTECGATRGAPYLYEYQDGAVPMIVHQWQNPCGHVDEYESMRREAYLNGLNHDGLPPYALLPEEERQKLELIEAAQFYVELSEKEVIKAYEDCKCVVNPQSLASELGSASVKWLHGLYIAMDRVERCKEVLKRAERHEKVTHDMIKGIWNTSTWGKSDG